MITFTVPFVPTAGAENEVGLIESEGPLERVVVSDRSGEAVEVEVWVFNCLKPANELVAGNNTV